MPARALGGRKVVPISRRTRAILDVGTENNMGFTTDHFVRALQRRWTCEASSRSVLNRSIVWSEGQGFDFNPARRADEPKRHPPAGRNTMTDDATPRRVDHETSVSALIAMVGLVFHPIVKALRKNKRPAEHRDEAKQESRNGKKSRCFQDASHPIARRGPDDKPYHQNQRHPIHRPAPRWPTTLIIRSPRRPVP
jgi:hypothetical protein